jgi:hypothetical protein
MGVDSTRPLKSRSIFLASFASTRSSLGSRHQTLHFLSQDVSFEPGVAMQSQISGVERHPVPLLIQPLDSLAQPQSCLRGVSVLLMREGQPQPVQYRSARPAVSRQALSQQKNEVLLGLAPPDLQRGLLGE